MIDAGEQQDGLVWSWEPDLAALVAAAAGTVGQGDGPGLGPDDRPGDGPGDEQSFGPGDGQSVDADAELAEYWEAIEAGRSEVVPLATVAGRLAESVPAGPDLAGWLATGAAGEFEDTALAGAASSYRRLASWAQAGELAVVAEIASRSAAADDRIGVDKQGRPGRLSPDACGEVSLALTMSQCGATWWADLAITLGWRLPATWAALRSGAIDLGRARAIAEATAMLDEDAARAVEARVLPFAGGQTMGQLRAALRRAVITADPKGAERRRQEAERRARVELYPDTEGTASLAGYNLPGVRATAAMARVSALARALKASGADGGVELLRAQVFLGLLLGTLPYIPPAASDLAPDDPQPGNPQPGHPQPGEPESGEPQSRELPGGSQAGWPEASAFVLPGPAAMGNLFPLGGGGLDLRLPWSTLAGESAKPGYLGRLGPITPSQASYLANLAARDAGVDWRVVVISKEGRAVGVTRVRRRTSRAGPPESTGPPASTGPPEPAGSAGLAGLTGLVKRVTVTIEQDRLNAPLKQAGRSRVAEDQAGGDPTGGGPTGGGPTGGGPTGGGPTGGGPTGGGPTGGGPTGGGPTGGGPTGGDPTGGGPTGGGPTGGGPMGGVMSRVLAAARRAAERVTDQAAVDENEVDGCAHLGSTSAYRPSPRLWEFITVRDVTCRFPTCRQPATRCDLDHTKPYDQGGLTCACNLGGLCRFHHQLKQHPRWRLIQPSPGSFAWTTPTGRTYEAEPDSHAA